MKNPNTAFCLNMLLPGAGHMYLSLWAEGAARFLLDVVLVYLSIDFEIPDVFFIPMMSVVNLWHGIDAYRKAKRMKEDEEYYPHSLMYHVQRPMPATTSNESFPTLTNPLPRQTAPNILGFQGVRESIVLRVSDLRVNEEAGYDGYITNKRIVLMKGDKFMDMPNTIISSISVEEDRKVKHKLIVLLLVYSGLMFLIQILMIPLPDPFGWFPLIALIVGYAWIFTKFFTAECEYVSISGGGRKIKIKGNKKVLQRFMAEAKQQALRSVQYSSSTSTDRLPQDTPILPFEFRQPPQTAYAKSVAKEEQLAKKRCPFCRNLIDSKFDICPYCKANVKRFYEGLV